MKHYRYYVSVVQLCLYCFLFLITVTTAGCGGGESKSRSLFTRVHRIDYSGLAFGFSMALDADNNIYAYTLTPVAGNRGITRFVKQSSGQYTSSRMVDGGYPISVSPVSQRIFLQDNRQIKVYDDAGQFITEKPRDFLDITVSNRRDVFVLGGGIVRLDEDGNELGRFTTGRNYLYAEIAADSEGNIAVLGAEDIPGVSDPPLILRVYSPEGTLLRETPLEEQGFPFENDFDSMAVGMNGKLYLTLDLTMIGVFDYQTGKSLGIQEGLEDTTGDIAVDADGNLYVMGGFQISIYKPNL